ncbi:hypothetical protein [Litorisediminicola beolgyonensis]|uniref:Uncharacterized protein n=1 Tax=Litorisediminicola beolgyonensis TaxID=1173614 RepID=A0ABW3ZEF2_9RHOB
MRHILILLSFLACAWAAWPSAVSAHETAHGASMVADCVDCIEVDGAGDHAEIDGCHKGPGCGPAIYTLPNVAELSVWAPVVARALRPAGSSPPRSIVIARDLPPPRA